ncbi:MAG: L,D-transpeptidase [Coxiella sp. (in: Bacteria)]|nr:MAG: L,D-transpeptidase [Coxiella sp. (in: g-proteobacteria)]
MTLRVLIVIFLVIQSVCSWAATESTNEYLIGGQQFIPDAEYGATLCDNPRYICKKVHARQSWKSLFPKKEQRELVMRLNRTNVALRYRSFIIVPKELAKANYMQLSPFPQHRDTDGHRLLYVDLGVFAFAAYNKHGSLMFWGPAAGGKPWCEDTKDSCSTATGDFHVFKIKGEDCQSGTYPMETKGGAPMPYCMYYHKGFAIHGSTLSGFINRSRGCVRLFDDDAKWLNQQFVQLGTEVIVSQ